MLHFFKEEVLKLEDEVAMDRSAAAQLRYGAGETPCLSSVTGPLGFLEKFIYWLVVFRHPSEKSWTSVGSMTFPIYGKIKMFQTTNQYIYIHICVFDI